MLKNNKYVIGWVNYANFFPVEYYLKKQLAELGIDFISGTPDKINDLLKNDHVLIALSSSLNLYRSKNLSEFLPLGIFAKGNVDSVYLAWNSNTNGMYEHFLWQISKLKKIRINLQKAYKKNKDKYNMANYGINNSKASFDNFTDIFVFKDIIKAQLDFAKQNNAKKKLDDFDFCITDQSKTTVMLLRILNSLVFCDDLVDKFSYINKSDYSHNKNYFSQLHKFYLLIGDDAIIHRNNFNYKIDLSWFWYEITGLSFVFAVWLYNKNIVHRFFLDHNSDNNHINYINHIDKINQLKSAIKNSTNLARKMINANPEYLLQKIDQKQKHLKSSQWNMLEYWQKKIFYQSIFKCINADNSVDKIDKNKEYFLVDELSELRVFFMYLDEILGF